MKNRFLPFLVAIPCFFPAIWRVATKSFTEPIGLCSDLGLGLAIFAIAWLGPQWLRVVLLLFWALFQAMSLELLAAVGRLPTYQDVQYLLDPSFVHKSAAGFHLAEPLVILVLLSSTLLAVLVPLARPRKRGLVVAVIFGLLLLVQANFSASHVNQSIAARYNPLHWFVADAVFQQRADGKDPGSLTDLPASLRTLDLQGQSLLDGNRVKNVLIVVLEGLSGIYHPEIRREMGVEDGPFEMTGLAAATGAAMLIPDFVTHSHQTIRGLYAIHCGDVSKLSSETPKGFELQLNPQRAEECLPARLAQSGWQTHFLQGAPLQFMNKDKVMPTMGFQEVHGVEWFADRKDKEFIWGTTDEDFFAGARKYLHSLQQSKKPWLLSLLTVATHQPFDAPDDQVKKYGSRKIASIARLDEAVTRFISGLQEDGILQNTLVVVTSDESHGFEGADWYSSWGYAAVLAPDQKKLPRLKEGTFGLMDVEASILDYLELPMPPSIIGRSFFRDYPAPREMVSNTSGKLRWQTADNRLYECSVDGTCYVNEAAKILKPQREKAHLDTEENGGRLYRLAALLDHKLTAGMEDKLLHFGHGEIRPLPEKVKNEWTDNLVGAQYLDFPKNSRVAVDIRLKAVATDEAGVQLKLVLRQYEKEVGTIPYPSCPLLKKGEECHLKFAFENPEARRAFSFHLVGEGENSAVQVEKFDVSIKQGG